MRRRIEFLSWIGNRLGKAPGLERVMRRLVPEGSCAAIPEICLVRDGSLFTTRLTLPIGWHVAFFGSYELELRDIMRVVLPTEGVAIDVGANVGWHTLLMATLVGPRGRVLAVEPNPSVREHLERNIRINRFDQVEIVACALGGSVGTLAFVAPTADDPGSASGYVVPEGKTAAGSISVEANTLDIVVEQRRLDRLDLIKIDAEGYEWPILQGAERTIVRFRPRIVFEFDQSYATLGGDSPALLGAFFKRHGYRLFSVGRNRAELVDSQPWPMVANIFAVP